MINAIDKQSPDIARGVDQAYEARHDPADDDVLDVAGAGDQGMMFGNATRETDVKPDLFDHVHDLTWERVDKADALRQAAGLGATEAAL